MPTKSIRYRDRGLNAIMRQINEAGNLGVRTGVLDPQASAIHPLRNNITVGEVAIINEYGSRRAGVPRRSFLKSTFVDGRNELIRLLTTAARQVVTQQLGPRAALQLVGAEMVKNVKATIESASVPPPNHPHTIEEKGHDRTLLHTGTLLDSISSDVVAKRGDTLTIYKDHGEGGADGAE